MVIGGMVGTAVSVRLFIFVQRLKTIRTLQKTEYSSSSLA